VYLLDTYIDRRIGKLQPTREIGIIGFTHTTLGGVCGAIETFSVLSLTATGAAAAHLLDNREK
jgi:hypothetical protein